MVSKFIKIGMFAALSFVYSTQSLATFGNCNNVKGTDGKVETVSLGYDDDADVNITFDFIPKNGSSRTVSVKRTIGDSSGNGMYQLLLTAQVTQSTFRVIRCTDNQLSGGEIRND